MIPLSKPLIGAAERSAVDRVLQSGQLAQGPEVAAFEDEYGELVAGRPCVAVNAGTSALHLALLVLGIGPGDEVIVPSFTFAATANSVRLVGAVPVFVDIDPDSFCISTEGIEAAIGPRTAAIMPVHLYGHPADMPVIMSIANRHGLAVIEDAAQAHAARLDDCPVGAWGTAAVFSFYPTKNMTTGEGGMLVVSDGHLARAARLLRNQGMERPYENEVVGFNLRMTEMSAALGRVQLRRLEQFTETRRMNAGVLDSTLDSADDVQAPTVPPNVRHVYHQYTVRCVDRARTRERLDAAAVASGVYYPVPVHRLPAFNVKADLPETDRAATEVLSVPVGPHLSRSDLDRVVGALCS